MALAPDRSLQLPSRSRSRSISRTRASVPRTETAGRPIGGLGRLFWLVVGLALGGLAAPASGEAAPDEFGGVWRVSAYQQAEPVRSPLAPLVPPGPWRPTDRAVQLAALPMRSPLEDPAESARRVREAIPSIASEIDPAKQIAALDAALLFESVRDWEAARFATERAITYGADDFETWRSLGRLALRTGDGALAEAAQLAALSHLPSTTDAILFVELRAKVHRDLATIYLLDGRERDAAIALENAKGLAPAGRVMSVWTSRQLFPIALRPRPIPGAPPPVWPERRQDSNWAAAGRMGSEIWNAIPPQGRARLEAGIAWLSEDARRSTLTTIAIVVIGLLLLLRSIRQRGDLIVTVEYPEELRGVFRVRVANARSRPRRSTGDIRGQILKGGVSTRYERHLVNRETQFHRMLSRRYAVTVEGVLLDPATEEILDDFSARKMVRVRHRRTVRLDFDAQPERCPVDVHAYWHDRPAEDVSIVAAGQPATLTRSHENHVRLRLEKGRHRLVVGAGDRIVEREVDVKTHRSTRVRMDLAGADVVFKGCPPAVEPYLHDDIEGVARALERDGQGLLAYRMLARQHAENGRAERAADYYETAGDSEAAARIRAELGDYERAARLYEQAELPLEAAPMWQRAGRLVQAGQAFEAARDFDRAVECYREADEVGMWINALEKRGQTFQAATLALENGQRSRAIRLLQLIPQDDTDFAEASWLIVGAFEREGHFDLAAQKLEQHIANFPQRNAPADRFSKLAELHESAGNIERALDVLENLRHREPTYPNIASRIELLKKQRSAADRIGRSSSPTSIPDTPTAFVSEYRYEILEEIGRGGMGVVFKARDRRLDRVVALKRLPEDLRRHQPRAMQLFLREAQAAARLNHPNIVTVHDTDQEDGHFFITMELLDGEPFNRILRERGTLSVTHAVAVGLQVASALEYAHGQGVVHRDVKTANLFLTTENVVKVMDFGLAKMFEDVRAGTTVVSGTPYYMSPEQIVGGAVDQRTDLYSLGVTLFELATGVVPFAQGDIAYHHRHTAPPDPREIHSGLPDAFAELLLDLLAKDPDVRCQNAGEVIRRLQAIQRELRALAAPTPTS